MRAAPIPSIKALQEVEALEERLQLVKWTISFSAPQPSAASIRGTQIVLRTAGLLGKRFPSGVRYERRLRRAWAKRLHRLGL